MLKLQWVRVRARVRVRVRGDVDVEAAMVMIGRHVRPIDMGRKRI